MSFHWIRNVWASVISTIKLVRQCILSSHYVNATLQDWPRTEEKWKGSRLWRKKKYKCDYDRGTREVSFLKSSKLVFVDNASLALKTRSLKSADNLTYRTFMTRAAVPLWVISIQNHTVSINIEEVSNTISKRRERQTRFESTKAGVCKERSLIKDDEEPGYNRYQSRKRIEAGEQHSINLTGKKRNINEDGR